MSNKNYTTLAGAVAGVNNSSKEYRIGISDSTWISKMAASSIENGIYVGSWNEQYGCYQLTLGTGQNYDVSYGGYIAESYKLTIPLRLFNIQNGKEEIGVSWSVEPISTRFTPSIDTNGNLLVIGPFINGYNIHDYIISGEYDVYDGDDTWANSEIVKIKAVVKNTEVTIIGWFGTSYKLLCLSDDTLITLFDDSQKELKDITKNDILKVWNFDEGCYDSSSILWITPILQAPRYYKVTTNTGRIIKCIGPDYTRTHRVFSLTKNRFEYPQNCIGDEIYTIDGIETIVSGEWVEESINYRNVITKYHMNSFGNSILTSCGFNNIYPIKDMKFIKEEREIRPKEEFNVEDELYYGLRLQEQYAPKEDILHYIEKLKKFGITK